MSENTISITGRVVDKIEATAITPNFTKGSVVVETNEEYPNYYQVDFTGKNIDKLEYAHIGETVEIRAGVRGTKYQKEGKPTMYFTQLNGFYLKGNKNGNSANNTPTAKPTQPNKDEDDLPF